MSMKVVFYLYERPPSDENPPRRMEVWTAVLPKFEHRWSFDGGATVYVVDAVIGTPEGAIVGLVPYTRENLGGPSAMRRLQAAIKACQ